MPFQNRVQPTGEIITHPTYGAYMGNRGVLHDAQQHLGRARWRTKAWVTCLLDFKGRNRTIMTPRRYTELFFWDEAVAFAAGHRPCAECRRTAFNDFKDAAGITGKISLFDADLHVSRAYARPYRQHRTVEALDGLPDGVFILREDGTPAMIREDAVFPFQPDGYAAPLPRGGAQDVTVLTPKPLIKALRGGYQLHVRICE